jgi:predicted nucleic acid-binding Zn ribbon protein
VKDEVTYEVECEVCEVESQVVVDLDEEIPAYCPMCGSPVEVN